MGQVNSDLLKFVGVQPKGETSKHGLTVLTELSFLMAYTMQGREVGAE
jgi:hypothetical protein